MEKRGAFHPLMDPFKMAANQEIVPDYREDMCPATLDRLSKVVYVSVNPNDTADVLEEKIRILKSALSALGKNEKKIIEVSYEHPHQKTRNDHCVIPRF
jgi:hypothetical protein